MVPSAKDLRQRVSNETNSMYMVVCAPHQCQTCKSLPKMNSLHPQFCLQIAKCWELCKRGGVEFFTLCFTPVAGNFVGQHDCLILLAYLKAQGI
eukprot:3805102-Amphidinium_carterae.1